MSDRVRRRVFFSGRVQGVGFRYTATTIARRWRVVGWVRNLRDGKVELLAEGPLAEIQGLLADIAAAMGGNIQETLFGDEPPTGEFDKFRQVETA